MKKRVRLIARIPIRYKISIIMIMILTLSIAGITWFLYNSEKRILLAEMKKRGNILSKNLAGAGFEAIVVKDKLASSDIIQEIMKERDIVYCMIFNNINRVVDSSLPADIGKIFRDTYTRSISRVKGLTNINVEYEEKAVLDVIRPIVVEHKKKTIKKGFVRIGMDWEVLEDQVRRAMWYAIFIAFLLLLMGVYISLQFAKRITTPILNIVGVMEKVGRGDLEQSVEVSRIDEIGKLARAFNEMIQHLKEKLMMTKYVSKSTMEMISRKEDTKLELGGQRKVVTLFFSDIRGFTAFSETKTPEHVISMLNRFLSIQAEIIDRNRGSIDKFVGDEVVAVFTDAKMVENAIRSAILIQKKIQEMNAQGKEKIGIGIGINTGEVVVGNMGSEKRMDYTVIGDNVNTASRLCSSAPAGQILVAEASYRSVRSRFRFRGPIALSVKGKREPLKVYEVVY